ncbi:MAG: gamma carbonic anhydrase family protein [Bacteroidota bacterium]|nr:gamma carbonic anhydrase family protein [Bacteroidota bacterium]
MPLIRSLNKITPKIGDDVFLAENCTVIGDVEIESGSSIWYNVVLRGDVNFIRIGKNVNIQDNVVVHCTYKKYPTIISEGVSIGHNAVIHACTIKKDVLIGMGAIIMDNVTIESNSVIAAGSVVVPNTIVKKSSIYAGIPAKKVKNADKNTQKLITTITKNYHKYVKWYKNEDNEK